MPGAALVAVLAGAALAAAPETGSWKDDFPDMKGAAFVRHLERAESGGLTIVAAPQVWSFPRDAGFASCSLAPTLEVRPGDAGEDVVTLWQRILRPGAELSLLSECAPVGSEPCPLRRSVAGKANGVVYADARATPSSEGFNGFPYTGDRPVNGAGWDSQPGHPRCIDEESAGGVLGGIASFDGKPVLQGGELSGLVPGATYAASFTAGARTDAQDSPYLGFEWFERTGRKAYGSWTASENELAEPSADFAGLSRFTVLLDPVPPVSGAVWDTRVISRAGREAHCTFLGPVYVTAQEGVMVTPDFDGISPRTVWKSVEWELEQNTTTVDPTCICPSPGSPITPVVVGFGAGNDPKSIEIVNPALPHPDAGDAAVPAEIAGRYFRFSVALYGRARARAVDRRFAPAHRNAYFAGWRPLVKRLTVRYEARAGRVVSTRIAPQSIGKWGKVIYDAKVPRGTKLVVDVLAADGSVLCRDIASGHDLGKIDHFVHTALMLRADLACDPANTGTRPVLRSWEVTWKPEPGKISLRKYSLSLASGAKFEGLVSVEEAGRVRVRVHDAMGREVARVFDAVTEAQAQRIAWDGRAADGTKVAPGTYSMTATTPRGAGTRKVTVKP